jgi:hypothetical protein
MLVQKTVSSRTNFAGRFSCWMLKRLPPDGKSSLQFVGIGLAASSTAGDRAGRERAGVARDGEQIVQVLCLIKSV